MENKLGEIGAWKDVVSFFETRANVLRQLIYPSRGKTSSSVDRIILGPGPRSHFFSFIRSPRGISDYTQFYISSIKRLFAREGLGYVNYLFFHVNKFGLGDHNTVSFQRASIHSFSSHGIFIFVCQPRIRKTIYIHIHTYVLLIYTYIYTCFYSFFYRYPLSISPMNIHRPAERNVKERQKLCF